MNSKSKKILIIRFNAIGDVLMSTMIPYAIKLKHKDAEIHYLTYEPNATMLENCPYIDKIIRYNGSILKTAQDIRKEKYDVIVTLNYLLKIYLIALLSFPKKLVFKSLKNVSWVESYFYTAKKIYKDLKLPKRLYLSHSNPEIRVKMLEKLSKYPRPYILFSPGKFENQKRQGRVWNIQKWKELQEKIKEKYGGTFFVIGSIDEFNYHSYLSSDNVLIFSGKHNLKETCSLISLSDLIISGDSGPVHIASAYNKKSIAILGSTSPDKIKPYGKNGYYVGPSIKCKYCWKKKCKYLSENNGYAPCIESITPEMIMNKIAENKLL